MMGRNVRSPQKNRRRKAAAATAGLVLSLASGTLASSGSVRLPTPEEAARSYFLETLPSPPPPSRLTHESVAEEQLRGDLRTLTLPPRRAQQVIDPAARVMGEVMHKFFGGMAPTPDGIQIPQVFERVIDEFEARIGDSNFSFVLQGVGNFRYLSQSQYYNELQGGPGVRYQFFSEDSHTRLFVHLSPAFGSISMIQNASGVEEHGDGSLPTALLYGGAGGAELSHDFGAVEAGIRAYVRPQIDLANPEALGISAFEALIFRFNMNELLNFRSDHLVRATVELSHFDRGDARQSLYDWTNGTRDVGAIRTVYQGVLTLEFRM